jgi:dihydrofolate reductase
MLPAIVTTLKQQVAKGDIYSFGDAGLARGLMSENLVDEYYLKVTPHVQGAGKRLFDTGLPQASLELVQARPLDVGSVILHYRRK